MGQAASTRPIPYDAIIVIGPSGSGKSTVGRELAAWAGCRFIEGDAHHPPGNLRKLRAGVPLTEADRKPFLDSVGRAIADAEEPVVVSCSALHRAHRNRLRSFAEDMLFVWLDVSQDELQRRLQNRENHFMPASQLSDQLANFEPPAPPEPFIRLDGDVPIAQQLRVIESNLEALR